MRPKVRPKYRAQAAKTKIEKLHSSKVRFLIGTDFRTRTRGSKKQIGKVFPIATPAGRKIDMEWLKTLRERAAQLKGFAMRRAREMGRMAAFPTELKEEYQRALKERPGLTPKQFLKENGIKEMQKEEPKPAPVPKEYPKAREEFYTPENLIARVTRLLVAKSRRPYAMAPWQRKKLEEDIARLEKMKAEIYALEESIKRAEMAGASTYMLLKRRGEMHEELRRMGGKYRAPLKRLKFRRGGKEKKTTAIVPTFGPGADYPEWRAARVESRTIPLPHYTSTEVQRIKRELAKRKHKIPRYYAKDVEKALAVT